MIDLVDLVEKVELAVESILGSKHSLDLERYIGRRLPLCYPNKGLWYMAKKGATFEVHHEQFDLSSFLENASRQTIETIIDHYGSTHQRDYCLVVLGHRFQGRQIVQFRGVLGQNRLYKILLLLRLAGVSKSQIVLCDHKPDYRAIVSRDLSALKEPFEHVVFGGDVIIKPFLSSRFILLFSARGEIVSWSVFQYESSKVLLTSYPYGDLSEYVVESLSSRVRKTIAFVGSTGVLTTDFPIGTIILPAKIYDFESLITSKFPNYLLDKMEKIGAKISDKHLSIKTPLVETTDMLSVLKSQGYKSIDVEAAHFQRGCEKYLADNTRVGVILFASDQPDSGMDLSKHDYSSDKSLNIRQHLAQVVESIQGDTI